MMRFSFEGRLYELDFTRTHREVRVGADGAQHTIKSSRPYTTVNILEVKEGKARPFWPIYRTATVGCWHKDVYDPETGRIRAIRSVSRTLPRDMLKPMWQAYLIPRKQQSIRDREAALRARYATLGAKLA